MKEGISAKFLYLIDQALSKKKTTKTKKEVQNFESEEAYFIKNGGILMEKQIALRQGQHIEAGLLKILSEDEIKTATNNYDPNLVVTHFQRGPIYICTLDDRTVAIKTPPKCDPNPELGDVFLTEVSMAMVMCPDYMVKVYGCCLETDIPMPVYQYVPESKTLYHHLHCDMALQKTLIWSHRLRVATDIAYALSYMHNAFGKPVVHRDIMPFYVLIDLSFRAKLTNFGHSVSITPGKKKQRWPVHGTPGYVDPEYIETREVTEKCDVYNFGVLMLELLTTREPAEMARCGKDLVEEFVSEVETNGGIAMIDKNVLKGVNLNKLERFVTLALTCVKKKGEERPTMIAVVNELWLIQDPDNGHEN